MSGGADSAAFGPGSVVTREAPAKLNLALAVSPPVAEGPKRGWHEIASWFAPIDLADTLTVTRLDDDRLSHYAILWAGERSERPAPRPTPIDWPILKDLAVRAHLLLERESGRTLPVRVRLEKRIPIGGGLGGGSSDAAAMLLALNDLFELGFSMERLRELSHELGSDVAFFLDEGIERPRSASDGSPTKPAQLLEKPTRLRSGLVRPAFVSGFGDCIERTPPVVGATGAPAHAVLVFPDFGCATPAVYKAFDAIDPATLRQSENYDARAAAARALAERGVLDEAVSRELFNDLAPAAEAVAPALRDLRDAIRRACDEEVHVTGSGSTLFFIARDRDQAGVVCDRVRPHALAVVSALAGPSPS